MTLFLPPDLFFAFKPAAWLLFFLPFFLLLFSALLKRRRRVASYFSTFQKNVLLVPRAYEKTKIALLLAIWFAATLALMNPRGDKVLSQGVQTKESLPVHIILDTSGSMKARDTSGGRERIGFAKEVINNLGTKLQEDGKTPLFSLITFDAAPHLNIPPTEDLVFFQLLIDLAEASGTTNLPVALHEFPSFLGKFSKGPVFIFTDGEETSSSTESIQTWPKDIPLRLIALGSEKGILLPGISYEGKPVITKKNLPYLKSIAEKTGGEVVDTEGKTPENIASSLKRLLDSYQFERKSSLVLDRVTSHSYEGFFLALVLLLFTALVVLKDTRGKLATFLLLIQPFFLFSDLTDAKALYEAGALVPSEILLDKLQEGSSWVVATWDRAVLLHTEHPLHALFFIESLPENLPINWENLIRKTASHLKKTTPAPNSTSGSFDPQEAFEALVYRLFQAADVKNILKESGEFLEHLQSWQKKVFNEGKCLRDPWVNFLPLFEKGRRALASEKPAQLKAALLYWSRALRTFYLPQKPCPDPAVDLQIKHLEERFLLDRSLQSQKTKADSPKGTKPW